jgi:hypothetical protein
MSTQTEISKLKFLVNELRKNKSINSSYIDLFLSGTSEQLSGNQFILSGSNVFFNVDTGSNTLFITASSSTIFNISGSQTISGSSFTLSGSGITFNSDPSSNNIIMTASLAGPAGGVLGYPGSTYPNPSGLNPPTQAAYGASSVNKIPIRSYGDGNRVQFIPDQHPTDYGNKGTGIEINGGLGISIQPFPSTPLASTGGDAFVKGGNGSPQIGGDGGAAYIQGGNGVYGGSSFFGFAGNGGNVEIIGGDGNNTTGVGANSKNGGDVKINGGIRSGPSTAGEDGDVIIANFRGNVAIGSATSTTTVSGNFIAPILGDASGSANATTVVAIQGQPVTSSTPLTGDSFYYSGSTWIHRQITPKYGNVVLVDGINGNDSLGVVNGFPFATVNAAINYVSSSALTNTLVYIAPNNYTLTNGITIPATCALRGMSTQTTKLVLTGSGAETTMFTMGENTRIEDLNLVLVSTSSTTNLTGIKLVGTTGTTSKLRTAVLTVDNSSVTASANTNVYGIWCSGSADLSPSDFSFNFTRGVTVNVFSNGGGNKRGVYANTNTAATFRDTNVYVKAPTSALSTGSYVGVETTNASSSLQFRTTSISGAPTSGSYSGSDIYQYEPATGFIDRGIQVGPGSDLINKTAGGRPFTTYVTPTTLNYGLHGNVPNATSYYWNGVQTAADATQVFYRFQQKSILQGMSVQLRVPPGSVAGTHIVNVNVLKSTTGVAGSGVLTAMTASLTDGDTAAYNYNCSVDFQRGEYLALQTTTTGGAGAAADLVVQLDVF